MNNIIEKIPDYTGIVLDLKNLIEAAHLKAVNSVNQIRLETYWQMGKRINVAKKTLSATVGNTFVKAIAEDLNLTSDLVYRISKFQNTYSLKQIKNEDFHLSWTHHIALLGLSDDNLRLTYLKEAKQNNWSHRQLRKAIKQKTLEAKSETPTTENKTLKRDLDPLYIYKAIVERVIDGDTLLARIDLGFHTWSEQRIRLHNINTKELNSTNKSDLQKAKAATEFVQQKLQDVEFIVLKSFKTDKYGRFVADVFYHPELTNKVQIAKEGFFLNQDLVDAGLADVV